MSASFPRFRPEVAPARTSSLGPLPESTQDIVTTQPLDVLHVLLPYLDNRSFVNLLSTCRTLRHRALTILQPHARKRVLELGWAVPTEVEYAGFVKRNPPTPASASPTSPTAPSATPPNTPASPEADKPCQPQADDGGTPTEKTPTDPSQDQAAPDLSHVAMAHATHSPVDADWYLYLSQVHRTQSMRARRWVWALATEVARVYRAKRPASPYADVLDADGGRVKSPAWKRYAEHVKESLMTRPFMTGAVSMGDAKGGNVKRFTW